MSEISEDKDESDQFNLVDFIEDSSALFVTMGVFGALAIYISQSSPNVLSEASMTVKTGFVVSFLLALLIFILIYTKMKDEFETWTELLHAHTQLRKYPTLSIFTILSILLISSISGILVQRQPVIFMLILTGVAFFGYIILFRMVYGIAKRVPSTPVWRISTVFLISLFGLVTTMYIRSNILNQYQITTIEELTFSNITPLAIDGIILFVGTVQSVSAIAILATIVSIPIVAIDKIRGVSPYDEVE